MDPFPNNAVAVEWDFRCHGGRALGHSWDWRCRTRDGALVAKSLVHFKSLHDAVTDAIANGFQYEPTHAAVSTHEAGLQA